MNLKNKVENLKKVVENCLKTNYNDRDYLENINIILNELKAINGYVKSDIGLNCLSTPTNGNVFKDLVQLLELVFKLCVEFSSNYMSSSDDLIKLIKIIFKITFELETTVVKVIEDFKLNMFDESIYDVTEICLVLSSCAVVAEKLDMKAGYPLWKSLKIITSTYCGTFLKVATDSCFIKLLNDSRQSFWFRYNNWKTNSLENVDCSQDHLAKELKMSSFLLKCSLTFISTFEKKFLENQMMMIEVFHLAFEILERKLELVIKCGSVNNINQQYDDCILYGCEIIISILLKHYQINDLISQIFIHFKDQQMISILLFGYFMKTLTKKNEPEQSSLYAQDIFQALIDNFSKVILNCDENIDRFSYVYKQLLVQTSAFICIHGPNTILLIESLIWNQLFTCNIPHVWIFISDLVVFLSRYGPIATISNYCCFLMKLIPELINNHFPIHFIMIIGSLFNRFIKLYSPASKNQLSETINDVTLIYFYPWNSTSDISKPVDKISNVIKIFLSQLKENNNVMRLSNIYELFFSGLLLEKFKNLGYTLSGIEENLIIIGEIFRTLSNDDNYSEINAMNNILKEIINQYSSNSVSGNKRKFPLNEENSTIKRQKYTIDELELSSNRLCSLIKQDGCILDDDCISKLRNIISTISNLL